VPMFSPALSERLDALIDDLIMDGGVEAASLASILLAAKDAVKSDHLVMLSRLVWTANNELEVELAGAEAAHDEEPAVSARPR
jgi:hypothetical protein